MTLKRKVTSVLLLFSLKGKQSSISHQRALELGYRRVSLKKNFFFPEKELGNWSPEGECLKKFAGLRCWEREQVGMSGFPEGQIRVGAERTS